MSIQWLAKAKLGMTKGDIEIMKRETTLVVEGKGIYFEIRTPSPASRRSLATMLALKTAS